MAETLEQLCARRDEAEQAARLGLKGSPSAANAGRHTHCAARPMGSHL